MEGKMEFLCDMWKYSAEEYLLFLERNGIKCFGVSFIYSNKVIVYADEEEYLYKSFNDVKFMQDEKQLIKLLERNETLVNKLMEVLAKMESTKDNTDEISQQFDEDE